MKEELAKLEETYLLELLQISSLDLVEKFEDYIEENYEELIKEIEETEDEVGEES